MARETIERNIQFDPKKKLYLVEFYFGLDESGKRVRKYKTYPTLREARAALRKHETARDQGTMVMPKEIKLSEWLDYWMTHIMEPKSQQTTLYGYKNMIENHIKPLLGNLKLQSLKPASIQKYYTTLMSERRLSPNTVIKHHNLLTTALTSAVKQEMLYKSPMSGVEPPKQIRTEANIYTIGELHKLFEIVEGTTINIAVKLYAYLGLRREEACGLTWNDLDFENRVIFIRKARTMAGSMILEKDTKNAASMRKLYMVDVLYELLMEEKNRQEENRKSLGAKYHPGEYVLAWDDGTPYRPNYLSERFTNLLKRHNLPKLVLHELRHTLSYRPSG